MYYRYMETNKNNTMNFEKAFVLGEDAGMANGSNWDGSIENRPTDADLEEMALVAFCFRGMKFESNFDGQASYIRGFWQGWRKGTTPAPAATFTMDPLKG